MNSSNDPSSGDRRLPSGARDGRARDRFGEPEIDTGRGSGGRGSRSERGAEAFDVPPFQRLARTHGLSVAGDTLLAIALADSLFFDVDPNDARWKVGAYLLLTIAPFAIVAPFLGPVMDRVRGGHRYMIIGTAVTRALLMLALVMYVQEWLLFPLAFAMLVMGKTYAVAKSAVVPTTVETEEALVRSNSRLSVLSAVSGAAIGVPGVILLRTGGAEYVLGLGVLVFLAAAVMAFQIPATKVAARPAEESERAELKSAGILVASSAMGYLRGAVGFITMLLAFDLRGGINPGPVSAGVEIGHRVRESLGLERLDLTSGGAPPWHFGVALIGVGIGGLIGASGVPRLRARLKEDRILAYALIGLTAFAVLAAISTGLAGAFIMAFAIALAAQGGKQAFDAIVQRDAPRANLGRTFSRYESRFQLVWVLGALIPVVIPLPARVGFILVAVSAGFVAATFWFGRTPNPAAIVSDGILDDALDRLADIAPGGLGRRLNERTWGRAVKDGGSAGGSGTTPTAESDRRRDPEADRTSGGRRRSRSTEERQPVANRGAKAGADTDVMPVPWSDVPADGDETTRMPSGAEETAIFPAIELDLPRPDGSVRRPPPEPDTWPTSKP